MSIPKTTCKSTKYGLFLGKLKRAYLQEDGANVDKKRKKEEKDNAYLAPTEISDSEGEESRQRNQVKNLGIGKKSTNPDKESQ